MSRNPIHPGMAEKSFLDSIAAQFPTGQEHRNHGPQWCRQVYVDAAVFRR